MKRIKFDNPWLVPTLFILLPVYGFALGFMLGPIFTPGAAKVPDTDMYTWGLAPNEMWGGIGFVAGILLAAAIIFQLNRTANIVIPDERFGHSDDEAEAQTEHH